MLINADNIYLLIMDIKQQCDCNLVIRFSFGHVSYQPIALFRLNISNLLLGIPNSKSYPHDLVVF